MEIVNRKGLELVITFPFYTKWEVGDYGTTLCKILADMSYIDINLSIEGTIESVVFGQYKQSSLTYLTEDDINSQSANKEKFEAAARQLKEIVIDL
jgi:hypothetical protein